MACSPRSSGSGWRAGRSYLEFVMGEFMEMRHEGWMILTRRLAALFAALAVINEVVWRTMSTDAWVKIETFALPAAIFAFFMLQGKLFERYGPERDDTA